MTTLAETSTLGFTLEARKLNKAVFAVEEKSVEEAARFEQFSVGVRIEAERFPNSAMDAVDSFCGNANGYPGFKGRQHLLQKGVELLLDLGHLRLDIAQHQGIVDGKREIEETCGHMRNIMLHYVSKESHESREAAEISGKLLRLWLDHDPEQAAGYFRENFRYNSRDALQSGMADRVCLVVARSERGTKPFNCEKLTPAPEAFATELNRPVFPSLGLS